MRKIYYVAGIKPEIITDYVYPIMNMLSAFSCSKYAHNIKMYTKGNTYKMVMDPIYDEIFDANPDGRKVHMFMIEGSETYIEYIKKYLFEGKAWERHDVTPYFEFKKGDGGEIVPVEWFSNEFKKFMYR